jgi:uncharacterized membrane protein YqiK
LHSEEQVAQQTAAVEQRRHEAAARARMRDAELAREVAQAELEAHEVLALAARNDASLARMRSELSAEVDERAAAVVRAQGLARAEVERQQAEVHYRQAEAEARRLLAENLPQLAAAFGERIGELKIAHYGGGDQPLAPLVGAVSALVDLAKSG